MYTGKIGMSTLPMDIYTVMVEAVTTIFMS
jgi:hypothetical protein